MGILDEFKEFAVKGNMIDMAVGIIIGGAFGKLVTSFVNDIIMPPIGLIVGGDRFANLSVTLKSATETTAAVTLNYGRFIQTAVDSLVVAGVIFMVIKSTNAIRREWEHQ
ncbi:MAG: large-conductance mechanosensitive channel protein MscL [Desulfosalsimonas sp.]